MTLAKPAIAVLTLGALASLSQSAIAQQFGSTDYVIISSHVDNVRQQKTVFQVISECTNNPICSIAASAVAASTGIPIDKMFTAVAILSSKSEGEGTYTNIGLPPGYAYCSSSMKLQSIVPRDGDRGAMFLGRADATGLYTETWTPVLPPFMGRSWVEGDLTVVGVRTDLAQSAYASGKCHAPGRAIFYCRGSGCEAGAVDTGQSVNTSSSPPAGGRNS